MTEFEERKEVARQEVIEFLSLLAPPRGVDDSKLAEIISSIADAFARRMPKHGDYVGRVKMVLTRLKDTHLSNSWPPQAAFVSAMPEREAIHPKAAESFHSQDQVQAYRNDLDAGRSVPDFVIWGPLSSHFPAQIIDNYRKASVASWVDVYRQEAPSLMHQKYGSHVARYFEGQTNETHHC